MKLPRDASGDDLAKALKVLGHQVTRQAGSQIRLTTSENGEHHVTIPKHDPLRIGTFAAILATWRRTLKLVVTSCWQD